MRRASQLIKRTNSKRLAALTERMTKQGAKDYDLCAFTQDEYDLAMRDLRPILRHGDRVLLLCFDDDAIIIPPIDRQWFR